ncbi:MAG: YitT family protein [Lachnospiraceae bacterium]|nr:YitT family protein [Lachnospiraceae bacterium]
MDAFAQKLKKPDKDMFLRWLYILAGMALYALSLNLFLVGNRIAAGGISGIATVLVTIVPLSVGTIILIINIPILLAAVVIKGWKYTAGTIVCALIYSAATDLLAFLPTLTEDNLTAAVFGGVLYGFGMAAVTLGRGSTGGTDLLSRLLIEKFPTMRVGMMSLIVDGITVILATIVFGNIEVALYASVTIIVCSMIADRLMISIDRASVCMLITSLHAHDVADPLMEEFHIAVTRIHGTGMFTDKERNILLFAISPREIHEVKHQMKDLDPTAFLIVLSASELVGGQFRPRFHRP